MARHADKHAENSTTLSERREAARISLLEAASRRFPGPDFSVSSDEKGTVWIKRTDGTRSVGLQPWQVRDKSTDEVIERAAHKLAH